MEPAPREVDVRVLQANERTLLAWIRTGLALMAFGFVVARLAVFLREIRPDAAGAPGPSLALGASFVLLGTVSNLVAARRYVRVRRALLRSEAIEPSGSAGIALAVAVAVLGAGIAVYVLTL